ncbi:hypothetical protein AABB24_036250, partial [Solanum stoloniferum]
KIPSYMKNLQELITLLSLCPGLVVHLPLTFSDCEETAKATLPSSDKRHRIPSSILEGMIDGTRKFHEQDVEVKKEYYSSDPTARRVRYDSNLHVYKSKGKTAYWKDSLIIPGFVSGHNEPEEIPEVCRKTSLEYINHVIKLEDTLLGLLSEALGLKPNNLQATKFDKGQTLICHYYPACPQPKLTLGIEKHTDPVFLTILLQDQNGGLQVMCDNQWPMLHRLNMVWLLILVTTFRSYQMTSL